MITTMPWLGVSLVLSLVGDVPEWGGFRGNNGVGLAESASLPDSLEADQSEWRVEVPAGYSSPTISGPNLFLTAVDGTMLLTLCLDRDTGEERWRAEVEYDGKRVGANSAAAPSPTTDGERVYSLFHSAGLIAYDLDGKELWHKDLGKFNIPHGMSTSPLVHGDRLIVSVDQDSESFLLALDKRTGETLWRVVREGATHSYSTPSIYQPKEGPAEVIVSGSLQLAGYSIEDGEKLWWVNGSAWQTKSIPLVVGDVCVVNAYMVPSSEFGIPTISESWEEMLESYDVDEDGRIAPSEYGSPSLKQAWFIFDLDDDKLLDEKEFNYLKLAGTAVGGLYAVRLGGRGDVTDTHVKWRYEGTRGLPDIPSPLIVDGTLFMVKEGGIFTAVDIETGEVSKQGRIGTPDRYFASPIGAAGKVITASHGGQLCVIGAAAEWEVISESSLDEEVWSSPAIAGDQVFIRSLKALYCFQAPRDV